MTPRTRDPDRHTSQRRLTHGKDAGPLQRPNRDTDPLRKPDMHALKDLFTTDVGLMSVAGIAFMLGMGVFFVRYFLRHMQEDAKKAAADAKR